MGKRLLLVVGLIAATVAIFALAGTDAFFSQGRSAPAALFACVAATSGAVAFVCLRRAFATTESGPLGVGKIAKGIAGAWIVLIAAFMVTVRWSDTHKAIRQAEEDVRFERDKPFDNEIELGYRREAIERIRDSLGKAGFWVSGGRKEAVREGIAQLESKCEEGRRAMRKREADSQGAMDAAQDRARGQMQEMQQNQRR